MTFAIVIVIVIVFAVVVSLSRSSAKNKERAISDLEAEKKAVGTFNILELVESEAEELGLTKIEGANDIPPSVLLKVWHDSQHVVVSCVGTEHLRYVVSQDTPHGDATETDVSLECTMRKTQTPDA